MAKGVSSHNKYISIFFPLSPSLFGDVPVAAELGHYGRIDSV